MRKLFWLCCFAFWIPTQLSGSTSILSGNIDDPTQTISVTFPTDYISGNRITFPIDVSDQGLYKIGFDIKTPVSGILTVGGWQTSIFLHPDDSLHLEIISVDDAGYGISFHGSHAAENQFISAMMKDGLQEDQIIYAMSTMEIDDYKTWLSEKYLQNKASYIQERSKGNFSKAFEIFMNSELDYNYAYFLLRYRIEYPIANDLVPPMALSKDYLSSLRGVVVNNESGIGSSAYRKFLNEYVALMRELEEDEQGLLVEENFIVNSKSSPLFAQPDVPPIYQSLDKGEMVKYLGDRSDFKTKSRIGGEISEDYWYKVKLSNGRNGWLLGHTIDQVDKARSKSSSPIKHEVTTVSKVVTKAIAIYDNLEVFNDPNQRQVIKTLGYGYEMDYPHVSTTENLSYEFQGINRLGKFVMVDINGEIGWVFEQGIRTQKKVVQSRKQRQVVTLAALKDYSQLDQTLSGTPLYYFIAKDLYSRMQYAPDENLDRDVRNFLNISDAPEVNTFIQYYHNELFGSALDFDLTSNDIQLVRLDNQYSSNSSENVVSRTTILDSNYEVYENYVVLPQVAEDANMLETRITLSNTNRLSVSVISDELAGRTRRIGNYRDGSNQATLSYDHVDNEWAVLTANGSVMPIFLGAGADIQISLDGDGKVQFNPSDSENTFLLDFHDTFHKREQSVTQKIRNINESDFKTYILGLAKQKLTFLEVKTKELQLSDAFVKDVSSDINYWMGYQLLRYTQEHPKYDKTWTLPKEVDNYFDFISAIDINPVGRTLGTNYRSFITAFLKYEHGKVENRNIDVKQLIESRFNGYSYYYLMAKELFTDVFTGDPIHVGKSIAAYMQRNPFARMNRSLIDVYNANLPLRAGIAAPYFEVKDQAGRTVTLSDYLGKIVVLDFWATWCAPCLEKMRSDQQITSHYSSKDVVFLYVSLDNNKSTWLNFLNSNRQLKGVHAMPNDQSIAFDSPIARAYKVGAIPAFYIIGKDGNLAYNPFTTLSPNRIRDHIDNLLSPR